MRRTLVFPWWRRVLHDHVVCMCTVVVWLLLCSGAAEKRHTHLYPSLLLLPLYLKSDRFVQEIHITWHLGGWVRLNELISLCLTCYNKCPELMYAFRITAIGIRSSSSRRTSTRIFGKRLWLCNHN